VLKRGCSSDWESTCFASRGSSVRSRSAPPRQVTEAGQPVTESGLGATIDCGRNSAQRWRLAAKGQSPALKAVGSLTIREGKAHSGLDESSGCEGLSCILPGRARQKARGQVAQTRS